jgi:hypothetical protein
VGGFVGGGEAPLLLLGGVLAMSRIFVGGGDSWWAGCGCWASHECGVVS